MGDADRASAALVDESLARKGLERAVLAGDAVAAEAAARLLLAGGRDESWLYDEVLRPLLEEVGHGWEQGRVSVEQEHTASAAVVVLLHRLAAPVRATGRGTIVLAGVPGEQHLLGLSMLRDVLVRAGWKVSFPGELPVDEVVAHCRRLGDDVRLLGLSLHTASRARALKAGIGQVRAVLPRLPVLVGGQAVCTDPSLGERLGADGVACDLQAAVRLVGELTSPVTARERQVLALVAQGLSNAQIAEQTSTSPSTVKTHLERVYTKLGTGDRAAAVARALRQGWIT